MKKTGFVFSHCHWDIEWYMPFRSFRFWLLDVFDRLLEIDKRQPAFKTYVLDGQVAPLEHYLAVKPEKTEAVRKLIRSGKLSIGPFYTQFDEWLVSPEAIIRNCLYGRRQAQGFGPVMQAGYLPDNFGHPRQMPQILAGFGLANMVFMRGMPDKPESIKDEFYWQGLDGTASLCIHLAQGYFSGGALGARPGCTRTVFRTGPYGDTFIGYESLLEPCTDCDVDQGAQGLIDLARQGSPGHPSGVIPIANGFDHCPPQAEIPDMIARANETQNEFEFVHGNVEELVRRVRASGVKLPVFTAELWGARHWGIHTGTLSTRAYIKQQNFAAESLLERYAEPLACLAAIHGKAYPETQLEEAWRCLFHNHAHDSIHGSSADPVHREMMQRFDAVRQIATGLTHASLKYLGQCLPAWPEKRKPGILAYNPAESGESPSIADLWIDPGNEDFHVEDQAGHALPTQLLDNPHAHVGDKKKGYYHAWPCQNPRHIIFAAPVPARGLASFAVVPGKTSSVKNHNMDHAIENEFLRVEFRKGALDIYAKPSKKWYRGLNVIEDEADAGDFWDFSEPWEPSPVLASNRFPSKCRLVENGPVRSSLSVETRMRVPACLNGEKRSRNMVSLPISATVALVQGARRVEVSLAFDNQARDHRLRLKAPTGIWTETIKSQGHFGIIKRPLRNPNTGKDWIQTPPPTFPFREWVAADDGKHGLAIACRGMYEYESAREGKQVSLYITLLRGIGRMTKANFKSRPTPACQFSLPATTAQCRGEQQFDYAFIPYACAVKGAPAPFAATAAAFLYPPVAHLLREEKAAAPRAVTAPLFRLQPGNLVVSCFKKAEDNNGYILRFWENAGKQTRARLTLADGFAKVVQTDLKEDAIGKLEVKNGVVGIELGGRAATMPFYRTATTPGVAAVRKNRNGLKFLYIDVAPFKIVTLRLGP